MSHPLHQALAFAGSELKVMIKERAVKPACARLPASLRDRPFEQLEGAAVDTFHDGPEPSVPRTLIVG